MASFVFSGELDLVCPLLLALVVAAWTFYVHGFPSLRVFKKKTRAALHERVSVHDKRTTRHDNPETQITDKRSRLLEGPGIIAEYHPEYHEYNLNLPLKPQYQQ